MTLTDKPFWITIQYICVLLLTVCFTGLLGSVSLSVSEASSLKPIDLR